MFNSQKNYLHVFMYKAYLLVRSNLIHLKHEIPTQKITLYNFIE